ncbi:MAG: guanylate kinase [Acidimicrobiaceae bacterium]|nr:guanylate kinase [Acidimicrobiaceae bacterium]MYG98313.1 guanylate kinase [Acidimicrobiaceae bacterium]MYL05213.1 guanylate kinase [Acidimicrobiaceae bacterium]
MTSLAGRSVIIVSGPGGVGKGTIVERLMERDPKLWLSRSWTTRPRRPSEPADAYRFVDRSAFEAAIAADGFLEWVEFLDYLQGTPVPEPPEGSDVVLEIDVRGGQQVRELLSDALLIFVDAPSPEHQRARLELRGDDPTTIARRMRKTASERAEALKMGYEIVVNDDLSRAVEAIEALIASDRERRRSASART